MRKFVVVMALMSILTILFTIIITIIDQSTSEPVTFTPPSAHHQDNNNNNNSSNNGAQSHPHSSSGETIPLEEHVKRILVPRVSGTPGNIEVRGYIVDILKKNNYHIELDEFEWPTPVGNVKFANIIADSNPKACRQLVLSCHYDSKKMPGFLGAIDSAVPCAMLLDLAKTFNQSFRNHSTSASSKENIGLRFIFFDGEEPFVEWTKTDSLYGSRHLASKWAKQAAPQECKKQNPTNSQHKYRNELDRIELFVLLDLIGTSDTTFVQFSSTVKRHYDALQKYEKEFILKSKPNSSSTQVKRQSAFNSRMQSASSVEDDHVPFKQRGVPVLHLITVPFPRVWHTVGDNYEAIDFGKSKRVLHAMQQFVANYNS